MIAPDPPKTFWYGFGGDRFYAAFLAAWPQSDGLAASVRAGQALAAKVIEGHGAVVTNAIPT